jgi:hypothetical protein
MLGAARKLQLSSGGKFPLDAKGIPRIACLVCSQMTDAGLGLRAARRRMELSEER